MDKSKDLGYRINTEMKAFLDEENHILTVETIKDGLINEHFQEVVRFKEETVLKALVKLGWTPPKSYGETELNQVAHDHDVWMLEQEVKKLKESVSMLKELHEHMKNWYKESGEELWDERFGDDWGHVTDFLSMLEGET